MSTRSKKSSAATSGAGTENPPSHSWRSLPPLPIFSEIWEHHAPQLQPLITEWRSQNRVPPVLLLTGPTGIGKNQIVHFLAQTLFCQNAGFEGPATQDTPCGTCFSCLKATHGNWVDFLEIAPDVEDGERGALKIEQFRSLKEKQGFSGFDQSHFVIHIRDADRMTTAAANSLLKILEEPPAGWIFFLTAPDPSLVLPTILSRCQRLRLRPLDTSTVRSLLERLEVPEDRRGTCALESQGSIERALLLARDEAWNKRGEISAFLKTPSQHFPGVFEWAAHSHENFDLLLDRLEQELHAQLSTGQQLDRAQLEFLVGRFERVVKLRQEALAPLNRKILLQDLLSPWLGAPA
jgi:hypothetical protein